MKPTRTRGHRGRSVSSPVQSEFAPTLVDLVCTAPGSLAAVLSDELGHPIDFAHDADEVAVLEVQLLGAQIGQTILRVDRDAARHLSPGPIVLVEAGQRGFVAAVVSRAYVVALLLGSRANLAAAMARLAQARTRLQQLLP